MRSAGAAFPQNIPALRRYSVLKGGAEMFFSVVRAWRWKQARERLEALGDYPGDRSTPRGVSTGLMGIGFLLGVLGFFLASSPLLLAGSILLPLGLALAFIRAVIEVLRSPRS